MALGGGTFTSQNKELPGAYINFVSAASASAALSDRGIATMPLELDWGVEGEVFEVTNEDFQKNSLKLFGYAFDSPKMLGLNDLFMGAKTLYVYRLNGGGDKAANTYATAKYCGVRGNDLKIVIQKNADDASKYDVTTYFGTVKVDTQTVVKAADLVANDYVTFKAADLAVTAGTPLTGGTNGSQSVMRSMKVSQPLMRFRMVGHQMRSMRVRHGVTVLLIRFQTLVCRMYSVRQIFLMWVITHQGSVMQ